MQRKRWTKKAENALIQGAGVYGISWFLKRVDGRTPDAVYAKARELIGAGGLTRGSYSLRQVCDMTGYNRTQILRAREALAQKWKRTSAKGSYIVYEDQLLDIVAWLKKDYWSKKHNLYVCLWCTTESMPHWSQGLCKRCYDCYAKRLQRLGLPLNPLDLLGVLDNLSDKARNRLERGLALVDPLWWEVVSGI